MKKLNKIIIAVLLVTLMLAIGILFSSSQIEFPGIYKSSDDFLKGKVTHVGKNTQIKLHETFNRDRIEVRCNDSTFSYLKKDIFGYIDNEGISYRFLDNDIYPILNPKEKILIYKRTIGMGTKNSPSVEKYFFSKEASSEILPLTLENIDIAFSNDIEFNKLIEIHFKNDNDLIEFDNAHKMYKLNRLLEVSKTGKSNS